MSERGGKREGGGTHRRRGLSHGTHVGFFSEGVTQLVSKEEEGEKKRSETEIEKRGVKGEGREERHTRK